MGLVSLWICLAKFSICLGSTVFLFSISPFWNGNVYPMPIPLLYFGNTQFVWFHRFTVVEEFCLRLNHISSLTQVQFSSVQFSSVAQSCLTLCDPILWQEKNLNINIFSCPLASCLPSTVLCVSALYIDRTPPIHGNTWSTTTAFF